MPQPLYSYTAQVEILVYSKSLSNLSQRFVASCFRTPFYVNGCFEKKATRLPLSLRLWNILVLVALQEQKNDWISMLCSHFSAFNTLFAGMIRSYTTSGIGSLTTATMDVNQSHIAIRLWLMLSNSISGERSERQITVSGVWNELWSAYEGFLDVIETEAHVGFHPVCCFLGCFKVSDTIALLDSGIPYDDISSRLTALYSIPQVTACPRQTHALGNP